MGASHITGLDDPRRRPEGGLQQRGSNPWDPADVTVDNCEREPIHIPNLIQPSGALIAFAPDSGLVLRASANLGRWFSGAADGAAGRPLLDVVGAIVHAQLLRAAAATIGAVVRHQAFDVPAGPSTGTSGPSIGLQGVLHRHQGLCIVEFEPAPAADTERDWRQSFRDTMEALRDAGGMNELLQRLAERVKRLTGFDRVMVYRFAADWHGQVVAEAREAGLESFAQLHFPAGDIPPQARALYRANLVRYIADAGYAAIAVESMGGPISPEPASGPLDMSHAMLRSVSPLHLLYLRNMGVRSTLTISLLIDGELWGLIACHHQAPTALPIGLRNACDVLALTAGYMVGGIEQKERARAAAQAATVLAEIGDAFKQVHAPMGEVVESCANFLLRIVAATAGALWQGEQIFPFGSWHPGERGASLVAHARRQLEMSDDDSFSTEHAALEPPLTADELGWGCGLLALRLDPTASAGIVWLRPEYRQQMIWGGDPANPAQMTRDAQGRPYLTPRASFERWEQEVMGRCRPWSDADHAAARSMLPLRQALLMRATLAQMGLGEQRFSGLVALQSDTYWQTDLYGRLTILSRPLPNGHGPAEGRTLAELLAPSCDAESLDALGSALAGRVAIRALRLRGGTPTGGAFELLFSGEPVCDQLGQVAGWHGTISDLTAEVAAQHAKRERDAAKLANAAKTRFLSQVSHELQTPLTTILGFSELLLLEGGLTTRQQQPLALIHKAGTWLQSMIADLLDLTRIETGNHRIALEPVEIRAVLDDAIELVNCQAEAQGLRITQDEFESPVIVRADPVRLKQVLLNLATNAVKYNRPAGEVRIAVVVDRARSRVRIEVHDTGLGMSREQRDQLFQPFNRLGREHEQIPGTGIGLVLSRHLVEAMGGELGVESELGRGSCFSVSLELMQPEPA